MKYTPNLKILTQKECNSLGWIFLTVGNTMCASKKINSKTEVTYRGSINYLRKVITELNYRKVNNMPL